MQHMIAALVLASCVAGPAVATGSALWQPHPVTMALTIGKWLLKEREQVYYVRVEAAGHTEQAAVTAAFRLAVSQALGSLILSESEVRNQEVVRNSIINYSAGYVDDHKILDRRSENGLIVVTADVWIKHSRLNQRLLNQSSTSGEINGARTRIQTHTLTHSRGEGDRVLAAVLEDFPGRAFTVSAGPTRTLYSDRRNRTIELSFRVQWNQLYLDSLREVLSQVAQNANAGACVGRYARSCSYQGYVTIKARPGTHGSSRTAAFDDSISLDLLHTHLIDSRPAVLVTVQDHNGSVAWRGCARYSELDNHKSGTVSTSLLVQPTAQGVLINSWVSFEARMPMNIAQSAPDLELASFDIIRGSQCPNN